MRHDDHFDDATQVIVSTRSRQEPLTALPPVYHASTIFFENIDLYEERSEEHTSELQSLMRLSYAVFCLKKKNTTKRSLSSIKQTSKLKTTKQNVYKNKLMYH